MSTWRFCILFLLLVTLLTSCSTAPTATKSPLTTVTPSLPSQAETATLGNGSMLTTGRIYSDASGDMPISFLDVVGFQAMVDEESETLKVILHMRDIPETATRGQVTNLVEYTCMVSIYLDRSHLSQTDQPGDYYFALNTTIEEPSAGTNRAIPGT